MENAPVFLFGATSILGWNLIRFDSERRLVPFCNPYIDRPACRDWRRLKLEDAEALGRLFSRETPSMLMHCGGICNVGECEENPEWAREINIQSISRLLDVLPRATRLVYCSSDHVFSGGSDRYDESSNPDPISIYGRSRVEAEKIIQARRPEALILRSSLAIGPSLDGRSGHLDWLMHRAPNALPMTIVEDELRSAVWVGDLVEAVMELADSDVGGIRHLPAARIVSRKELAEKLLRAIGLKGTFIMERAADRATPHIGRIDLVSRHEDPPLPSVMDRLNEVVKDRLSLGEYNGKEEI